jgi:hypothetical protein
MGNGFRGFVVDVKGRNGAGAAVDVFDSER